MEAAFAATSIVCSRVLTLPQSAGRQVTKEDTGGISASTRSSRQKILTTRCRLRSIHRKVSIPRCFVGQSFHCIPVFFQRYSCHSTLYHGLRPTVQNENRPVLLYCRLILATKSTKTDFPQAGVPLAMMSLYNSVRAIIPLTKWEEIYDMLFERVLPCCSINQ